MIKESPWEDVVFPKPQNPDEKIKVKTLNQLEDHYEKNRGMLESVCVDSLFRNPLLLEEVAPTKPVISKT